MSTVSVRLATDPELQKKVFVLREEVFVVEQKVSREDEFDEFEEKSRHFAALNENGEVVGAARWRFTNNGVKLERFAVKKSERGKGVGSRLVKDVLDDVRVQAEPLTKAYLHAQLEAVRLYEKHGFEKKGEMFEECGIQHYLMERII